MKKCPYCGKEYADDVSHCAVDGEYLGGELSDVSISTPDSLVVVSSSPAIPSTNVSSRTPLTERQLLTLEVFFVCLVAFGVSFLSSFYSLTVDNYSSRIRDAYGATSAVVRQGAVLGILSYILLRRGKSFSDFGLVWAPKDFGWSIILRVAGSLAFFGVLKGLDWLKIFAHHKASTSGHHAPTFDALIPLLVFTCVNPFFEELIVRAYLMTTVRFLTQSTIVAVFLSTVLQSSYHLYQGIPAAIAHSATFLIWSIYYAKTGRITSIIFAHLYWDIFLTLRDFFPF